MTSQDNFGQFFSKKAYEISYAAFRIGSAVKTQGFSDRLFDQAFSLLDLAARGKYSECKNIGSAMDYFLRFGGDTGVVHPRNVEVMAQEIHQFNSAIAEYEKLSKQSTFVGIEESFSKMPARFREKKDSSPSSSGFTRMEVGISAINPNPLDFGASSVIGHSEDSRGPIDGSEESQKDAIHGTAKSAIRQSAILQIIRQSGNPSAGRAGCRLKDIQESLHDASERTIRYDLKDLMGQGFIERVGNGGPSTYYKDSKQMDKTNGGGTSEMGETTE